MSIKRHLAYARYMLRHKWYVLLAGIDLCVPLWMLILHDWDKFLPSMWVSYAFCFYKRDGSNRYIETPDFTQDWNAHQKRNKHHWQWWILVWDKGTEELVPMQDVYIREMVADWHGAGRTIAFFKGESWSPLDTVIWYHKNRDSIRLHFLTRAKVEYELREIEADQHRRVMLGIGR